MAKSSRSRTVKANNRRLKKDVFAPVENARIERLSAKLLELASQPKPQRPIPEAEMVDAQEEGSEEMEIEKNDATAVAATSEPKASDTNTMAMDVDGDKKVKAGTKAGQGRVGKRRIEKKKKPKNSIVFRSLRNLRAKKKKS